MRIALLGYGKMGKMIEKILLERGHTTSGIIHSKNTRDIPRVLENSDVAIEFSVPETCVQNILTCIDYQIPIVVGTTGWYNELPNIKKLVLTKDAACIFASNFSVGVNLFFEFNKKLASIMHKHKEYKVELEEIHHTQKKDMPSGTAISLAKGVMETYTNFSNWSLENTPNDQMLKIVAKRAHDVIGTHTVRYVSNIDEISITHNAFNRKGFAMGSVLAAEWIYGKKGFYEFQEIINQL